MTRDDMRRRILRNAVGAGLFVTNSELGETLSMTTPATEQLKLRTFSMFVSGR